MKNRSMVLVVSCVLLNTILIVESYCLPSPPMDTEETRVVLYDDIVAVHDKRTAERIDILKK